MKKAIALLLTMVMALSLIACGQKNPPADSGGTPAGSSVSSADPAAEGETLIGALPTFSDDIGLLPSETEKNPALEALIADTWDIPEEAYSQTRYYYNYVDLNGDGTEELFAVAIGMYTSGTGGDSALIAAQVNGKLELNQTFTLIHEPVIISDKMTNGCHEIIVPYTGGGAESSYHVLTCSDGVYTNVPDGAVIETLEGVSGTAILYNDLAADLDSGAALYLG